ncbi:MAG: hypothetical protein ACK2T6_03050 [Anaerolineae bacterium]
MTFEPGLSRAPAVALGLAAMLIFALAAVAARTAAAPAAVVTAAAPAPALAPAPRAAAVPVGRDTEPVVLSGEQLGHFLGLAVSRVGVWAYRDSSWARIASQVDQRDGDGAFVPVEGADRLDGNDELVFTAGALGDARPGADSWPPGVSQELSPATIVVDDPLGAGEIGRAYVFDSPPDSPTPAVAFDSATNEIRSTAYVLGFATAEDGYFGLKRLSLLGDERDRVDRSKFRLSIPQLGEFTEEDLGAFGVVPRVEPLIEGPVRLVMDASGASTAYAERATLLGLDLPIDEIPLIPGVEIRLSLDLDPSAVGATYRDENIPSGVLVDGQPDTVRVLPFPMWREVVFEEGRLVSLAAGAPPPIVVRGYYKDDATPDDADTGDLASYGDTGVVAVLLSGLIDVGFLGQMVVLEPDDPVNAEDLAEQLAHPLLLHVDVAPKQWPVHLPLCTK